MSEGFSCPRRDEAFNAVSAYPTEDQWYNRGGRKTCSYCGSLSPDEFFAAVEAGTEITPTDKNYKAYVGSEKFYFQHLSVEERKRFIELLNAKKMKLAYPGHFYRMPFFCQRVDKAAG